MNGGNLKKTDEILALETLPMITANLVYEHFKKFALISKTVRDREKQTKFRDHIY